MLSADVSRLSGFLKQARSRLTTLAMLQGAALGLVAAMLVTVAGWPRIGNLLGTILIGVILMLAGVVLRLLQTGKQRSRPAYALERRSPDCQNLLITGAEQLAAVPAPEHQYVHGLVMQRATMLTESLHLRQLVPLRTSVLAVVVALALWVVGVVWHERPDLVTQVTAGIVPTALAADRVEITVTPPAYTAEPVQSLRDPARITVITGSRLAVVVRSAAAAVTLETVQGTSSLARSTAGAFRGDVTVNADGFLAIQALTQDGKPAARQVVGVTVRADESPRVRITAPGKDLHVADGNRVVDLAIAADDDIGLATLRLKYTKVSGSGERFSFVEGEVPLTVARTDARQWQAHASWRLAPLALEPGDMLVYRAVATDARPGAVPVESDAWIVEITAPGGIAAAGFALDPEQERYAVSQQMVILKTERLIARRSTLSAEVVADSAAQLAAEQRKVRAEFVFMMGGEVGDDQGNDISMTDLNEESEANGESDLAAGRMANAGRVALLRGIRFMSRAATGLTAIDLPGALAEEKQALTEIEKAFSHSRIILRALTQREQLDFTRRLSGTLADAARTTRPSAAPESNAHLTTLRQALAGMTTLAIDTTMQQRDAAAASRLAESVLRVDPAAKPLQQVSALLGDAASALRTGKSLQARMLLGRAASMLSAAIRPELPRSAGGADLAEPRALQGALTDALRAARKPQ